MGYKGESKRPSDPCCPSQKLKLGTITLLEVQQDLSGCALSVTVRNTALHSIRKCAVLPPDPKGKWEGKWVQQDMAVTLIGSQPWRWCSTHESADQSEQAMNTLNWMTGKAPHEHA